MAKSDKVKKSEKIIKVVLVSLFVFIGLVIGATLTYKFLIKDDDIETVENSELMEITDDNKYTELYNGLLNILDKDPLFYSSKGIDVSKFDNNFKLSLLYRYMLRNNLVTRESIPSIYLGAPNCQNEFITDPNETDPNISSNVCTVNKINKQDLSDLNMKLFNSSVVDLSVNFTPFAGVSCVNNNDTYLCGRVLETDKNYTGNLESNFTILKVTKDSEGTIEIYEKGYLNDKRRPTDPNVKIEYDNYYLHSSDSNNYYFQLDGDKNLTFKHVFKTNDRKNYYYVSSSVVKE